LPTIRPESRLAPQKGGRPSGWKQVEANLKRASRYSGKAVTDIDFLRQRLLHIGYPVNRMRMWQTVRRSALSRHIHEHAYAALVLSGGYEEAGDLGRFQVQAGDIVLHECFEAHLDRFSASGAKILNIDLPVNRSLRSGLGSVADPDLIVLAAEKSAEEAAALIVSLTEPKVPGCSDWPDELAATLTKNPAMRLARWCEMRGISPWSVSRGFAQVFGIAPSSFRARMRARRAWKAIYTTNEPLARIAADLGFSDQAHMTRSVRSLTGCAPRGWRSAAN
jgi:AraC-like DNA-binding protein